MKTYRDIKHLLLGFTATAALSALAHPVPALAQAQTQTYSFDIPAQDLESALRAFAAASHQQIAFDSNLVRGRRSVALKGTYSVRSGLDRLLSGSGLSSEIGNSGVIIVSAKGNVPNAPREAEAAAESADIVVTGTRIRNTPIASPLSKLSRDDVDRSGAATLGEALRLLSQNFAARDIANTLKFTQGRVLDFSGSSGPDLRGLGSGSTLTLLDGERIAPASGAAGTFVGISAIPMAAFERVEIVPDGSSATYGSDAVGGVINFILRRDLEGGETNLRYSNDTRTQGSAATTISQVFGTRFGRLNLVAGFEHFKSDDLPNDEREFSESADKRNLGGSDLRFPNFGEPGTVFALDGNLNLVQAAQGLASPVTQVALPPNQNGTNINLATLPVNQGNFSDLMTGGTLYPGETHTSGFFSARFKPSSAFHADLFGLYSYRAVKMALGQLFGLVTVPASNPFNPFGEPVRVQFGLERNVVESNSYAKTRFWTVNPSFTLNTGLGPEGNEWTLRLSGVASEDHFDSAYRDLDPAAATARAALTTPDALNLFGDGSANDESTLAIIAPFSLVNGRSQMQSLALRADGGLLELPGGTIRTALSLEARHEEFFFQYGQQAPGQGSRGVRAASAEVALPLVAKGMLSLIDGLTLTAAVRHERYSDFGGTANPKLGFMLYAVPGLRFRGTWGTSFRAPTLFDVHAPGLSTTRTVRDPKRGGIVVVVPADTRASPDIREENARVYTLGVDLKPVDAITASITYFNIDYKNRIVKLPVLTLLAEEDRLPSGIVVRSPTGELTFLRLGSFNSARTSLSGLDLSASVRSPLLGGTASLTTNATYNFKYKDRFAAGSIARSSLGRFGFPVRWKGRAELAYQRGAARVAMAAKYTHSYLDNVSLLNGKPLRIPALVTFDLNTELNLGRVGPGSGLFRLGVINLFDKDPPFLNNSFGFDNVNADGRGRTVYVQLNFRI